jgi:hypothetical protein
MILMLRSRLRPLPVLVAMAITALAAACSSDSQRTDAAAETNPDPPSVASVDDPEARLAITYDGGVLVLRATDGEVLADEAMAGFIRVNPAGDERHVLVSAPGSFTALDLGTWTADHGDHGHSWADDPKLTEFTIAAAEPGHVVSHHGRTALFDDATGTMTSFETHELTDLSRSRPELTTHQADVAHHGVAVRTHAGGWLHTVGTSESRSGVRVVSPSGAEVASSEQCPGIHGEAFAGEVAVFGCEDGVLLVDGRTIEKIPAPDDYGRIGNQAGSETSPYVLGDYKTDPDAELERPTRVSVIDTGTASLRLVDVGTSYTFRSLGRTPSGDGLVLGTDGSLHVVDMAGAKVSTSLPVVEPWREPVDWEQPRPALEVVGETAYITEPASRELHVVDLTSMKVSATHELPETPNELVGVTG